MKKLILLSAILTLATVATADIGPGESYKNGVVAQNHFSGTAGGLGVVKDITTNDTKEHNGNTGGSRVNILRDKGPGWEDEAKTRVILKVIQPIKIKSESNRIFTESVAGDELQIGDIGFKVSGDGDAKVEFTFKGNLFKDIDGLAQIKSLDNSFFPLKTATLGTGAEVTKEDDVLLVAGREENLEIDLSFNLDGVKPGIKRGIIVARAMYK